MKTKNISLYLILGIVSFLLSIPFVAMQFTEEVSWKFGDFIVMGTLLTIVGLGINYIIKKQLKPRQKVAFIVAILGSFLLVWAELAVGIFGTPFAGS